MYRFFIKRLIDIIVALIALPFILFLLVPIGIAIKKEDGGKIFYLSDRLGLDMKIFKMYKIRTMKENAPDIRNPDGTTFNAENDSRVTNVGRFLRKTSLDELPQFINVLVGDMSLIGPRPSPVGDKSHFPKKFFKKYEVKPGITGYNQALLRNSATMEQRIDNDAFYVDHLSLTLDVMIIWWTIKSVLHQQNINSR